MICFATGSKVIAGGNGEFGMIAIWSGKTTGPYYGTQAFAKAECVHRVTFCYNEAKNQPSWYYDGKTVRHAYILNRLEPFPTARNVQVSIFPTTEPTENTFGSIVFSFNIFQKVKLALPDEWAMSGFPITATKYKATYLNSNMWPQSYCIESDVRFPPTLDVTYGKGADGYSGALFLMGD